MFPTRTLENLARTMLPRGVARWGKRWAVHARYRSQCAGCRAGYQTYGERYPHPVLFIAGLPKSGTTWLERMVSSFPGYHELLIPDVARHELRTGGSHDFELPDDLFSRFDRMLVLTKMHVHGSPHNTAVLHDAGVPYVVLFRDLRDVAISNYFYVRQTPWHLEYDVYADCDLESGLEAFAERTLGPYADWVRSWHDNHQPESGLIVRYEEMLDDSHAVLRSIVDHFKLDADDALVNQIVEANQFKRLAAGRESGEQSESSFFRKGVAGDWKNQFTPRLRDVYKRVIGDFLIDYGYEEDLSW